MNCPNPLTYSIKKGDNLYHLSRYFKTTVRDILALNPNVDPYNLKVGAQLTICPGKSFNAQSEAQPSCPNPSLQFGLLKDMRLAWSQHVYWTRMLLISIAERLGDLDAVEKRLLQNPVDVGAIFAKYYSDNITKTIVQLLRELLQIGAALITALRDGNSPEAQNLMRQWYLNADQMAEAFGSINPYYDTEALRKMLYSHLQLTSQEVSLRLAGDYAADIEAFDEVEKEALDMADAFSSGIMKQFPQKFS